MPKELAALGVTQILGRQPAQALDERAGDLAAIDARIDRPADVHQHIAARHFHLAGEAIDENLGARRAHREVEERVARAAVAGLARPGPVDARRCIEAAFAEGNARAVAETDEILEGHLLRRIILVPDEAVTED